MNYLTLLTLASMFVIGVHANGHKDEHSGCYNYFLGKDHCVWGSEEHPCGSNEYAGKPSVRINTFQHPLQKSEVITKRALALDGESSQNPTTLTRRYDTTAPTTAVGGGTGICGKYDTDDTLGVCLWTGEGWVINGKNQTGWVNGNQDGNCNKQVYIQRKGQPKTVQYANVLDGCSMNIQDPEEGCFQAWMSIGLFKKFKPTRAELEAYTMEGLFTWDFNNLDGKRPKNAPI